jgi:hypothetical protein
VRCGLSVARWLSHSGTFVSLTVTNDEWDAGPVGSMGPDILSGEGGSRAPFYFISLFLSAEQCATPRSHVRREKALDDCG